MPRKPQFNVRLPVGLLDRVDARLDTENEGRAVEITRTDLITALLTFWANGGPSFDELNRASVPEHGNRVGPGKTAPGKGGKR